ncbi:MAG: type II toxin-antitoxin system RelE/ParE family toxin [Firmicutes bacterium]|nr:type II toxin-antitoxin system RelE/ParE family toxin [Bacillota bacterium]
MKKYTIHYSETAAKDLNETADYIDHVLLNPKATDALLDALDEQLNHLENYPQGHSIVDDPFLLTHGIRFVVVNNYLAFYTIDEEKKIVHIIRFLYEKRDWIKVLKQGFSLN